MLAALSVQTTEEAEERRRELERLLCRTGQGEREAFGKIDPFFHRELKVVRADPSRCAGRLFVESDGRLRSCNISPPMEINWYDLQDRLPEPVCDRKRCSCYLAYGGREDLAEKEAFGAYPLFRILT